MRRAILCLLLAGLLCAPTTAGAAGSPAIVNGAPTGIRNIEATLHFSIDPEGQATSYYVEYGMTTSYGSHAQIYDEEVPAGDDPVGLSQVLSVWGLKKGTTYHYRVVATNAEGTTFGPDAEVTMTSEPAPTVATGEASEDTGASVVLHGTVDPEGLPVTTCRFHYIEKKNHDRYGFTYSIGPVPELMGTLVPCAETTEEIGAGTEPVPVHAVIPDYDPGRWLFRLEAENAYDEAVPGAAGKFGTEPPSIQYLDPDPLRNKSATVRFVVDPSELDTEYEVEWGLQAGVYHELNYLWDGTVSAEEGPVLREAELPAYWENGFWPGTTVHWRVVARNAAGATEGPDETFTTPNEPAALVTTSPVSEATTENVHFEGTVDPEGNPLTGCRFRWVTPSTYQFAGFEKWAATKPVRFGWTAPCAESSEEIGDGTEPVAVHADVSGIEKGTYYVRLEVENAYEDTTVETGPAFTVVVPGEAGEVGKGCEHDPGCGPPATKPPEVTPPQGPPAAKAQAKAKKKKKLRKKRRHRAHHNARISARR